MRVFLGLPLNTYWLEEIKKIQAEWKHKFRSRISWSAPGNHHITLKFLGEVEEEKIAAIKEVLSALNFPRFELEWEGLGFFYAQKQVRVMWLGFKVHPVLSELVEKLEKEFLALGFPPERRKFVAHLTLGRVKKFEPQDPWTNFKKNLEQKSWAPYPVEKVVLWQSFLRPQGPLYKPLFSKEAF
jgi:2'-5' RNA ligase